MAAHFLSPPMTPSARIPAASASRYLPPPRPPTPTPDVSARKDQEDAGVLRDRKAIVTHIDDVLASRKRKREEEAPLPPDPYSVVREQKSKQPRIALSPRSESPAPRHAAAGEGEAPDSPPPTAPETSSEFFLTTPQPPQHAELLHGELVSLYCGEESSADIAPHTLLYEHAVYTENNETLAISTDPSHGVYAECIGDGIVWVFSSTQAVGLLTVRQEHIEHLATHLPEALAEFMTANGSSQGIRIQLAYSPQGYREELIERIRQAGVESTRTRLGLADSLDEAEVIEAAVTHEAGRWPDRLSALASRWGAESEIVEIPNEAIHISRDGIDLFDSEPYAQLPASLDALPD